MSAGCRDKYTLDCVNPMATSLLAHEFCEPFHEVTIQGRFLVYAGIRAMIRVENVGIY
jgi:hypothetical protein